MRDQNGVVLDRGRGEEEIDLAALALGADGCFGLGPNPRVYLRRLSRDRVDVEQLELTFHSLEVLVAPASILDPVVDLSDRQDAGRDASPSRSAVEVLPTASLPIEGVDDRDRIEKPDHSRSGSCA